MKYIQLTNRKDGTKHLRIQIPDAFWIWVAAATGAVIAAFSVFR